MGILRESDAVVHLAGESIAEGRWTEEKKRRILESRQKGTRLLAEKIAGLPEPPAVMVSVSAIGYYGRQGKRVAHGGERIRGPLPLRGLPGVGGRGGPGAEAGVRVVHPEVRHRCSGGIEHQVGALGDDVAVSSSSGGGRIGSGRQYWRGSFDDVIGAIVHALDDEASEVLSTSCDPRSPDQRGIHKGARQAFSNRPTFFTVPAPAARVALGGIADELLLASTGRPASRDRATSSATRTRRRTATSLEK